MSKKNPDTSADNIRRSAERMSRTRSQPGESPLRGFGAFGIIGWSVAVPAVGGAFLGMWLDRVAPQSFSWPLALILGGLVIGGIIAWGWIERESPKEDQRGANHRSGNNDKDGSNDRSNP